MSDYRVVERFGDDGTFYEVQVSQDCELPPDEQRWGYWEQSNDLGVALLMAKSYQNPKVVWPDE